MLQMWIVDGPEQPADITNLPPGPLISYSEFVRYKNHFLRERLRILKLFTSSIKPKPDVWASVFSFAYATLK